jgi:2-(1,2-epoxy-1,2-dihydrophenyl)acetyl-CoA isomerase
MDKAVLLEKQNAIASITMNRPNVLNAMNGDLVDGLAEALTEAGNDPDIRVIILKGNGKGFCAGGDLPFLQSIPSQIEIRKFIMDAGNLVKIIIELEKPIIAMVHGAAAGAGFNLAMACDIVICSEAAKFAQSFSKVGLVSDCGGNYTLPRLVGVHKAKELMFTAELIDAQTALALGLVNKVVANENVEKEAYNFAQKLVDSAPTAMSFIKMLVNRSEHMDLNTTLEMEADLQTLCIQTEDHKEGVRAFLEKRKAKFTGK